MIDGNTYKIVNMFSKLIIEVIDEKANPVSGSKFNLLDEKGKVINSFITTDKSYTIAGLTIGKR